MFCNPSAIKKLLRSAENKTVAALATLVTHVGDRLLIVLESEATANLTDLIPGDTDDKLVEALKKGIQNCILSSAHFRHCLSIEDDKLRVDCYRKALRQLTPQQWKDEVGLFAGRLLRELLAQVAGIRQKYGLCKAIIELVVLTRKR